ncbi:MAG: isoprenylcysteine carboxylmethyltransferase family protein [Candidatus Omnitrophota bacterium]|nr:isoprenylcysteine carboxylmethyltransferase family protein [Candidatus Omnitrophota bacterium]
MNIHERFKRWFKLRFFITYPFGIFVLFYPACSPTYYSFKAGIYFIIAGLLTRLWANGYAIKTERLTVSGPYSLIRHPLYLGTMLIAIGFSIMLRTSYIGALFIIVMAIVYYRTIKNEERALTERYKEAYLDYKAKVPAILPTIFPYKTGEKWHFSFARVIENHEYKLFIWIINITIIFRLKGYFIIEHESMDIKKWVLIILFFVLGAVDIAGEIIKGKRKRLSRR